MPTAPRTHFVTLDEVLGGLFYSRLSADPSATFTSNQAVGEYAEQLMAAIAAAGYDCHSKLDRYRSAGILDDLADIVSAEDGGYRLAPGVGIEEVAERFFGSIPIPVIRIMDTIDVSDLT